jgi:hypothetical protein
MSSSERLSRGRRWSASSGERRFRPLSTRGIAALVVTKGADLLTTAYGILLVEGVVEVNPIAATVFARTGVLGLVAMSVVGTAIVVLVVEWGANAVRRLTGDDRSVRWLYVGGYAPLACLSALATVNNLSVVAS